MSRPTAGRDERGRGCVMRVIVRMWTAEGYHKDVAVLSERQVHSSYHGMEPSLRHMAAPIDAPRVLVDPALFPEAVEFEVIVEGDQR